MLVAARLRHIAGTRWGTRRYMKMDRIGEAATEKAAPAEGSLRRDAGPRTPWDLPHWSRGKGDEDDTEVGG